MPDLLLELLSEEIPARMQKRACDDLKRLVTDALVERGFLYEGAATFATPRRLTLHVAGLPARGQDVREERKGPRVGAPEAALAGFLRSTGLSLDQLTVVSDAKKGDSYLAVIDRPGRATADVLAEILPAVIRDFPWPKSMRWGAASAEGGSLRWVRPLQSILCTFGGEAEEPEVVPFSIEGIASGDVTRGHRFLAPGDIRARRFDDYVAALERAKVVLDPARRADIILHDARDLAFAQGLDLVEDQALLDEVAGLVEWPVVLMGAFDEAFLAMPPEVIRTTIRANQKCFVLRQSLSLPAGRGRVGESRPGEGHAPEPSPDTPPHPDGASRRSSSPRERGEETALANRFILVANLVASDGGTAIVAGNERVVRARLSDAKFFWDTDRKTPLIDRLDKLKSIVFHEKLGTQFERVERIAALARDLAPITGADPDLCERAARLAKADLVTEMVGEFPELQGLMGRYYAAQQGEPASVAAAIEEHYKPLGPSDRVPGDPVSVAVALADKLDTLVGFWAIDEKPTGSKDPYALRRAALGVVRLVLENGLRLDIVEYSTAALRLHVTKDISFYPMYKELSEKWENRVPYIFKEAVENYYRARVPWFLADKRDNLLRAAIDIQQLEDSQRYWSETAILIPFDQLADIYEIDHGLECSTITDGLGYDETEAEIRARINNEFSETVLPISRDLLSFFHDRLKVYLRERGARHDLIDAVLSAQSNQPRHAEEARNAPSRSTQGGGASFETQAAPAPQDDESRGQPANDDLLMIVRRVEALGAFLASEEGRNLLAGVKRAANILRIEEKKDSRAYDEAPDADLLAEPEERALAAALDGAAATIEAAVASEDFAGALGSVAALRPAVDAFFDKVTVNVDDAPLRANRLRLLNRLRAATRGVADFSKIEG